MNQMGIDDSDIMASIKKDKARIYPQCFESLVPNTTLIAFIRKMKSSGVKTAIASTAQKENLMNVLNHLHLAGLFDEIIAGTGVKKGKPDPEIYLKAMEVLGVSPEETLIFEDSEVGLQAAEASGANFMRITQLFFE
jgi:HAD superfamily hydrolase (TIGR01509 family)